MNKLQTLYIWIALILLFTGCGQIAPPTPYGVLPTDAQIEWQKMEYYMFIHFGPNTFTNVEWGDGKEDPNVFNPTALDCKQWVETAKKAGMKAVIITAKHHDGFCLWPSAHSTHTVRESVWREGKGDVLRELSEACREAGLKFGVYLSPWDRSHPAYGTPEYNQVFAQTLTEVLSNYGEVFEQWFDGANGEGPNGKRQVYDWELFHETVYHHQPNAIIFSDVGPGCRWIGNEAGYAGETNWSRMDVAGYAPGNSPALDTLNSGNKYGAAWVPGETDVSIRPGWFYSDDTNDRVKTINELVEIYFASVGRNSNLLLNIPPDKRGLIHPNDSTRLMELREVLDGMFETNLAQGKTAKANEVRGNSSLYDASHVLNPDYDTYWTTDDDVQTAFVEIDLKGKTAINCIVLKEYIPLGQRIAQFSVEGWNEETESWEKLVSATTIGYKRILRFSTYTTNKIRVNIESSLASPILNGVELYRIPENYIPREEENCVDVVREANDLPTDKWKVLSPDNAVDIIDGKMTTVSIEKNTPVVLDLGEKTSFKGFFYIPEYDPASSHISRYNFLISSDGKEWTVALSNVMFNNIKNNPIRQNQLFDGEVKAKYVKLEPVELTQPSDVYTIAELGILK